MLNTLHFHNFYIIAFFKNDRQFCICTVFKKINSRYFFPGIRQSVQLSPFRQLGDVEQAENGSSTIHGGKSSTTNSLSSLFGNDR